MKQPPEAFGFTPGHTVRLRGLKAGVIGAEKLPDSVEYAINREFGADTIAGKPCKVIYYFFASRETDIETATARGREDKERFWSDDEKAAAGKIHLGGITIEFNQIHFQEVTEALAQRYGAPGRKSTGTTKNMVGVEVANAVLEWTIGADKILASERAGRIDKSSVSFVRQSTIDAAKAITAAEKARAARDL